MRKFFIDTILTTIFIFAILWTLNGISQLNIFDALDPISQALEDTELTDYAFSSLRVEDPPIDTNIIIVNTGALSREMIGRQIEIMNSLEPKVIAVDIIFSCDGGLRDSVNCPQAYDTLGNRVLGDAVRNAKNIVMAHKLWQTRLIRETEDTDVYDSLEHTDEHLRINAYEGFVNLITGADHQEDLKICREFNPAKYVTGEKHYAFSVQTAMLYDSFTTQNFLDRENEIEIVNYRGNIVDWHGASTYAGRYIVLDWDQALDTSTFATGMIKDKIVLMGYLGDDLRDTSWDDKFFTPLNKKFGGRARPDMYGVVVHANIISMILNKDYVEQLADWQKYLFAVIICYFNVALFWLIFFRLPLLFDTLQISLQLMQLATFAVLIPYMFYWYQLKMDITIGLVALALAGPCFEIYITVIDFGVNYVRKKWLTKTENEVLTT
ncbi:MAG: CHASE2 domain-containing protein [Cyclobacteriaceae bacterium]|jgi:CHASE2 domain-containing sensor protein|nr:CHASE2 domain-containing protein [Cyclobacteriaceae bacterium]